MDVAALEPILRSVMVSSDPDECSLLTGAAVVSTTAAVSSLLLEASGRRTGLAALEGETGAGAGTDRVCCCHSELELCVAV